MKSVNGILEGTTYFDLSSVDVPIYGEDYEKENGIPQAIQDLFDEISKYDGFVIATPEHNGALPAFFKNVLDWLSRHNREVFGGKPVVILATSPGQYGAQNALSTLEKMLGYFAADVKGKFSLGGFYDNFDQENLVIKDSDKLEELKGLLKLL